MQEIPNPIGNLKTNRDEDQVSFHLIKGNIVLVWMPIIREREGRYLTEKIYDFFVSKKCMCELHYFILYFKID